MVKRAAGRKTDPDSRLSSRAGKVAVLLRVEPGVRHALRQLALDEGTSVQALGVEALTRLLAERGSKVVAR